MVHYSKNVAIVMDTLKRYQYEPSTIATSESLAGLRFAAVGAKQTSTGRLAPRYGYVFFLALGKASCVN